MHEPAPSTKWKQEWNPSRQSSYRMNWKRLHSSMRWMERRGFTCTRFHNNLRLTWIFLAVSETRVCAVLSRHKMWCYDEDIKRLLRRFKSNKIDLLVLRWDHYAKKPRLARINHDGTYEEVFRDPILD